MAVVKNATQDALASFGEATRAWFSTSFESPTPVQEGAWGAIGAAQDALIVAPTGSGKTLSAFLWAIDRMVTAPVPASKASRTRVLYLSPLKALAVDVERNLRSPLIGIRQAAKRLGIETREVTVGVRSGDTPAAERRRLVSHPPDILITTPESLFLLLTSQAREALRGIETVIVDEVHAVAGTKRGAHLAVSLERLDALLVKPAQRIGLSATVRPMEETARFLGGVKPVSIVAPPSRKEWDLKVVVPVEDMTEVSLSVQRDSSEGDASSASEERASIWPHVEEHVVDLISQHRSTIVFANSRRLAERLTARFNEIAAKRAGAEVSHKGSVGSPAQVMAQSGQMDGAALLIARAHHGSVSKEQRAQIEEDLKRGTLPCVVATSSLELGIDMGAVDLVVQIESPPSVASALQRVGRSGHHVGEISRGILFPKHRADLLHTAVTVERMRSGQIESLKVPSNPLDVLAQHIVSVAVNEDWDVDDLYGLIRRAAPYANLPRSAFDATLDMLSGRYPSDEFAELRPRIIWDRIAGTIAARPGAQRLAVTSGGTIPDRGLFGVFLVGQKGGRVGELDEEMVYESRVGDVFALGATSWRIEEITHDRVLVAPAPGQPARLPFWKGDQLGRPAELGAAIGAFAREISSMSAKQAEDRARVAGLDEWAVRNLVEFLGEQRDATGTIPNDQTFLIEKFRDELGDWRIVVHSPYGAQVHAPWALAIASRLREYYGVEAQALPGDDGIVLRIPDTDLDPPGADLLMFDPEELQDIITREASSSALFASRFRECAARALLLPRRNPGKRSPLWLQRQRSAQLLEVASKYPTFPIVLEALREVLQDVYDVPALLQLMRDLGSRRIRTLEVTTAQPSPFARSLLFHYVAAFLYEGDAPLAERKAAALALDQGLLAELLGRAELRELLDPKIIKDLEDELQRKTTERQARNIEEVVDLLRLLGPLGLLEIQERVQVGVREAVAAWVESLVKSRRAIQVRIAGEERLAAVEDAARLRDALGVPVPQGVADAFLEVAEDPLGDLVSRFARTHSPFQATTVGERFGLGVAVVNQTLERLASLGRLVEGEFRPDGYGTEWCDSEVLRRLRSRSLAALRKEVEPVDPEAFGRFLPEWQGLTGPNRLRSGEGLSAVIEQLAGCPVPASALEPLILGTRLGDYTPASLDELIVSGEILWSGNGALSGNDGWVSLHLADTAPLTLPEPEVFELTETHKALLDALNGGGAFFFRQLVEATHPHIGLVEDSEIETAMWDLAWAGYITSDTLAPVRARLARGRTTHRPSKTAKSVARPARSARRLGMSVPRRTGSPSVSGRWALLPPTDSDPTKRAHARAAALLERHGVVTRGAVVSERVPGGFAGVYRVLAAFEESGRCRRGHFIASLGAAQFGAPGAVDRLRAFASQPNEHDADPVALTLAATDPANPYGAALPWPERAQDESGSVSGHRPGRKAGALVVLIGGALALYVERGGKTLLTFGNDAEVLGLAAKSLALAARQGALGKLTVERADGADLSAGGSEALRDALQAAGFVVTHRGLRLRI